ncbi:glycosyltransferase [Cryobacterium sp. TMT1-3]|uniref:glycosyltransferase family 2 protein n=1 Tax=Cryobacterium sp. TMT1-3 TaxID=1259237 RepID=UPI001069AD06|nr:glycosyltransferase [Cryobacterium sp. TMT1-3]TFC27304.1 glycosyltransferase [Cryobacterium sp. TMT1-3]
MANSLLVVLPTLGERIDSLKEALASVSATAKVVNLRLIVVLPVIAQEARLLAAEHGAEIIDDPRQGLAGAMNAGIAARAGEKYYVGLGDDDLLRPTGIRALFHRAEEHQDVVVAYGACDYINAESRVIGTNRVGKLATLILSWGPNLIPHPGALVDLDALQGIGGFALNRPYTMDLDAFLQLKKVGRFVFVPDAVSAFRWHADSLTVADRRKSAAEALDVKRSYLPAAVRSLSVAWLGPISWATRVAGNVVSYRAGKIATASTAGTGK